MSGNRWVLLTAGPCCAILLPMVTLLIPPRFYTIDAVTNCYVWKGRLNKQGRPVSVLGTPLFRLICEAAHGPPLNPKFHAAHTCHNRVCINPSHAEWQPPEVNNPSLPESEPVEGISVRLKKRRSSKGGGRYFEGWCAVFNWNGKAYKSGAYYSKEAALGWAQNKIGMLRST